MQQHPWLLGSSVSIWMITTPSDSGDDGGDDSGGSRISGGGCGGGCGGGNAGGNGNGNDDDNNGGDTAMVVGTDPDNNQLKAAAEEALGRK